MVNPADQIRSFSIFLTEIADGEVHDNLTREMREVIRAMQEAAAISGGKATGAIKLDIKLRLDRGAFDVTAEVAVKKPKLRHGLSLFWPTADGLLCRQDPRQQNLPLRDVSGATEVRTITG